MSYTSKGLSHIYVLRTESCTRMSEIARETSRIIDDKTWTSNGEVSSYGKPDLCLEEDFGVGVYSIALWRCK
jgi:hypothetical protein